MQPLKDINCLFLDLNSYFASVEQEVTPSLRGRPVAVVPMDTDSTCAIAASKEAKSYGIKTGTKIYHAKTLCPGLICVPARHDLYVRYHHKIIEEINKHIPIQKVHSIDEVSCYLTGNEQKIDYAYNLAQAIKTGIKENVGEYLRSSIGIAPNSLLAKIASNIKKNDGLVVIPAGRILERIEHLSLLDLPGINVRMRQRLLNAGVRNVRHLWNADPWHIRKVWGGVQGERFWYSLHGYYVPPIETRKSNIGHSRILAPEVRKVDKAKIVARALLLKALKRLRRYGLAAGAFSISVRSLRNIRIEFNSRFPATQNSFEFLKVFEEHWVELLKHLGTCQHIKKVSINLYHLEEGETHQLDFFDVLQKNGNQYERSNLWHLIDELNTKYGNDIVFLASQSDLNTRYLGTKIAFSRIPDIQEFSE